MMKLFPEASFTLVAVILLFMLTATFHFLHGAGDRRARRTSRAMRTQNFSASGRMPDAKMAAEGAKIFGPTCGFCHGADARGGSVPDLLRPLCGGGWTTTRASSSDRQYTTASKFKRDVRLSPP